MDMSHIGIRIKERRKELHLTQMQIKAATGLSSGHMSEIENGKILPSSGTLCQLSQILNCSIDWMLTGISFKNEILNEHNSKETYLLELFSQLTESGKKEILEYIEFKILKTKKSKETLNLKELNNSSEMA